MGIALYIPVLESLYFRLREDYSFAHPDDFEFIAGTNTILESVANEMGARAAFLWMESSLSNKVFVEGPTDLLIADPEHTVALVYKQTIDATSPL